jgi:5-hydroxyisourate hydrolase
MVIAVLQVGWKSGLAPHRGVGPWQTDSLKLQYFVSMKRGIASRNHTCRIRRRKLLMAGLGHVMMCLPPHRPARIKMGKLSTHVLDTAHGCPGAGILVELYAIDAGARTLVASAVTNNDGRCASPLLEAEAMQPGQYELVFYAGDYYAARGVALSTPRFLDRIVLAFGIADASQNYHVPLVMTPWSYSTYRGS